MSEREIDNEVHRLTVHLKSAVLSENLRAVNHSIIDAAAKDKNVLLLRLYADFFQAAYPMLRNVHQLLKVSMYERGYRNPETLLTPAKMKVYDRLELVKGSLPNSHDFEGVRIAAALSGETDHSFLASLIRERQPRNGEEFTALLENLRGVPKSVSSGAL